MVQVHLGPQHITAGQPRISHPGLIAFSGSLGTDRARIGHGWFLERPDRASPVPDGRRHRRCPHHCRRPCQAGHRRGTVDLPGAREALVLWRETERGEDRPTIAVAAGGTVFHVERRETADGQRAFEGTLDLFAPYGGGVDLRQPAEHLRIAPGRCSGEPHLVGTRLTTRTVASLADRGYDIDMVARLYPGEDVEGLREALTLEEKLAGAAA